MDLSWCFVWWWFVTRTLVRQPFSAVADDQVCSFIVNPFPNLAGSRENLSPLEPTNMQITFRNAFKVARRTAKKTILFFSEEIAYKNAAKPLDSVSFQILLPNSKTNFDKQNILEGELDEKREIYKLYLSRIQANKDFKDEIDRESCDEFVLLVSRYYMLKKSNLFTETRDSKIQDRSTAQRLWNRCRRNRFGCSRVQSDSPSHLNKTMERKVWTIYFCSSLESYQRRETNPSWKRSSLCVERNSAFFDSYSKVSADRKVSEILLFATRYVKQVWDMEKRFRISQQFQAFQPSVRRFSTRVSG